ncbi:hypothetical protein GCM10011611_11680 [Aliidongia dinghuensis]|uniref:Yip1 domain-containing protein n=1 Tax=Aliidongia dinghuensis TaxID=1867774 RepID=A0A8J2YQM6_9PROT|nr:Yip1 family protein [Aliidongia dinghuensis]GGF07864.1 hypothetical protein GCM10011611_11680 [Aliidongia dinghuensis]
MTVLDHPPAAFAGIVARIKAILLSPLTEWPKIEAEPATIGGLYTGYILILAAIRPVCSAIHGIVFGYGFAGFSYRPSVGSALSTAILQYVLALAGVFVLALVIDVLAPRFGGQSNRVQAFKVAAYSSTAAWVAGIFSLLPWLGVLGILGLYSLYLLYLGLPRLMKAPEAKALGYTATVIVVAVVLYLVLGFIGGRLAGFGASVPPERAATATQGSAGSAGTIDLPNGAHLDMGKLQSAVNQLGAVAKQIDPSQSGNKSTDAGAPPVKAVSTDSLKALLPASLPGGFSRTELSSGTAFGGAGAEATYQSGSNTLKLSVTDLAAAGSLASLAGVFGIESDHETATGFDKVARVNGQLTVQQYDRQSHAGKYSVLIDDRFMIGAEGTVGSFDDLKSAVATIAPERVLALR